MQLDIVIICLTDVIRSDDYQQSIQIINGVISSKRSLLVRSVLERHDRKTH